MPRIISDEETSILIKPRDVNALVEAIERLIDDPLLVKRMGKAGRKRIEEQYSWETICDNLEESYQEVIERFKRSSR